MNSTHTPIVGNAAAPATQRGVATLMVALVILAILTVIVLASTGMSIFEQRTATNENRQRLADQAARYSLNMTGEFFKANIANVGSSQFGGWLATSTKRWTKCTTVMDATTKIAANLADGSPHPCMAETNATRRAELYFYNFNHGLSDNFLVPFDSLTPAAGKLTTVGGAAGFPSSAKVRALLCRIDTTLTEIDFGPDGVLGGGDDTTVYAPDCKADPNGASDNRISLTFITRAQLDNEAAVAEAKETWASFNSVATTSTVPLVASGGVDMQGNVEIVTSPNGAGYGLPVSMWSAENVDVDKNPNLPGGGSAASISSCQLGEFLNKPYRDHGSTPTPLSELKTTCVASNTACGCPAAQSGSTDFLSGKVSPASNYCCENVDILDIDCGNGSPNPNPDIQFFPGMGHVYTGTPVACVKGAAQAYDHAYDAAKSADYNASALSDDSLFEWVFGVPYESISMNAGGNGQTLTNCGPANNQNCAIYALTSADQLNAQLVSCAEINAIGAEAVGLYYVTDSVASGANGCQLPAQVGSPEAQAIVVLDDKAKVNQTVFYGMLMVRSNTRAADLHITGKAYVFGSVVVEGSTTGNGGATIVYDPTQASAPGEKLPEQTRLGRLAGSWLDGRGGGF
jgi:hypothetical protein